VSVKIKILHLAYQPGSTKMVEEALTEGGMLYNLISVNTKQSFTDALHKLMPDIILADDLLPGFNTLNVLAHPKHNEFDIPVISLAHPQLQNDVATIVNIMKQGAYDYILPDDIGSLPAAIADSLKKHKINQQLALSEIHEQALKISEANLSAIIENTTDLVYSLDTDLKFITFNQLFKTTIKAVYGFDIEQGVAILEHLFSYSLEMAKKWTDIYARALKGETQQFVIEYPFGEGKVYLSYSINPIRETGKVIGLSCFSRDITSQKLLELEREKITADLLQRNKALEQFTYIISHNLRAPVANIIGLAAYLGTIQIEDEEVHDIVKNISRSADKLDEVISDLNQVLQVNKAITENIDLVLLPVLIQDIEFSIKNLMEKEKVSIVCNFEESGEIYSLKSFMHSIFYNLILNSIKYSRPGISPVINISAKIINGETIIIYNDNGRGIDTAKYGNEIFGLYKRFDTSVDGKGMGLFMVKMQVESLGGNITVNSVINRGTTFTIKFPIRQPEKVEI
jgi:signal transduction histidine kinase/CheY-like chemotaxis protein